jgi:hypothetical protein
VYKRVVVSGEMALLSVLGLTGYLRIVRSGSPLQLAGPGV